MENAELERIDKMLKASGLAGKVFQLDGDEIDGYCSFDICELNGDGSRQSIATVDDRNVAWLYANAPQAIDELLTEVNRLRNVSQAYMVLNGDFDN